MTGSWTIRPETPEDVAAIYDLTQRAFLTQPHADGDEQDLIDRLRACGELSLSLVALSKVGVLVGHIGFSPVTIDGSACGWFQLAPVSAEPALHHRGIRSALIRSGIAELRARGARGIGVVGDPAYYERFGFGQIEGLAPDGPDARYFRAMVLQDPAPRGVVRYAAAFG